MASVDGASAAFSGADRSSPTTSSWGGRSRWSPRQSLPRIRRWGRQADGRSSPHVTRGRDWRSCGLVQAGGVAVHDGDKLWKYTAEQVPADETPSVLADTHVPFSPTLYASRTQVPITVWHDHFADADRRIDVLVFAATFLFDTLDGFTTTLTQAAGRGVQVRVLVGDPNGDNMALRGEEEGIGESVKARSHNSVELLRPYATTSGLDVRTHETTLYTSIFRVDDDMIINFHIYGSPGRNNPVMIFSRSQEPRLWATLEQAFDRVWDNAKPLVSPANPSL
ncbi:phospholipase D family protein [Mycobacteroides abscessus]|uniref:phospholipase D family protein n=1 Tax=Mycobacteroides abscessus TaxID=36809 RepID=UPI001F45444E|nr:phospholipase D family protein [Mycobacteroides abscessus]